MADDPIIVRQGLYPRKNAAINDEGVCLVLDIQGTWSIDEKEDGAVTINIPAGSNWTVKVDEGPDGKGKKIAVLRKNGKLGSAVPLDAKKELEIHYAAD